MKTLVPLTSSSPPFLSSGYRTTMVSNYIINITLLMSRVLSIFMILKCKYEFICISFGRIQL